jgi:hypothetical protein
MATLHRIISMLDEQRRELLDQLDAVDKAIAALKSAGVAVADTRPAEPAIQANTVQADTVPADTVPADTLPADGVSTDAAGGAVVPTRVKPRRVLSDAHRQALVVSKRKAREAREATAGLAREMPGDSFVPAVGTRGDGQAPRLVKRK